MVRTNRRMGKRGFLPWFTIVEAVIVFMGFLFVGSTLSGFLSEGSQVALGFSEIVPVVDTASEQFKINGQDYSTVSASMTAFTYALNALAVEDYYTKLGMGSFDEGARLLNMPSDLSLVGTDLRVSRIPFGLEPREAPSTLRARWKQKPNAYLPIILSVLDCYRKFKDEGFENTNCFELTLRDDVNWDEISSSDLYEWVENHDCEVDETWCTGDELLHRELLKLHRIGSSNLPNEKLAGELIDLADDLFGSISNVYIKVGENGESETLTKGETYYVCGVPYTSRYAIIITDNWAEHCGTLSEGGGSSRYAYLVDNFELPQDHKEIIEDYQIDSWIDSHGDPQYVVYYQAFPEGEDAIWQVTTVGAIARSVFIATTVGLVFDVATFGLGKLFSAFVARYVSVELQAAAKETTKKAAETALTPVRVAINAASKAVAELVKLFGKDPAKVISSKAVTDMLMIVLRNQPEFLERFGVDAGSDLAQFFAQQASKDLLSDPRLYFTSAGKLTREGLEKIHEHLLREVGEEAAEEIGKEVLERMVQRAFSRLVFNDDFYREYVEAVNVLTLMKSYLRELDEVASEAVNSRISRSVAQLSLMKPAAMNRVVGKYVSQMARVWNKAGGDAAWDAGFEQVGKSTLQEISERFTRIIPNNIGGPFAEKIWRNGQSLIFTGAEFTGKTAGRAGKFVFFGNNKVLPKKRFIAMVLFAIWYASEQNKMEKFRNIGENAIGLRTPFTNTVVYGQHTLPRDQQVIIRQSDPRAVKLKGLENRREFMAQYGQIYEDDPGDENGAISSATEQVRYEGLLPEVGAYNIQLIRDQFPWWPSQDNQQFFLVSPMMGVLKLYIDQCACYGDEDPENGIFQYGKAYPEHDIPAREFLGGQFGEEMLYRIESNQPQRICNAASWYSWEGVWSTVYRPQCIMVNPLLEEGYNGGYNFGYGGTHQVADGLKLAVTASQIGITAYAWIGAAAACGGATFFSAGTAAAPACAASFKFAVAASVLANSIGESIKHGITEGMTKWPNHGDGT